MPAYAVVSCHVERPLDDRCWNLFSRLQARAPGGFRIAALMRPPDGATEEACADDWVDRARQAASRGPLGHHTHFVGAGHARPPAAGPEHAARVRREAAWIREHGLAPTVWCGGGWYIDSDVAAAVAELGYADCTATAFRPPYLAAGAPRLAAVAPVNVLVAGRTLLELPSTHSLGMAVRLAVARVLPDHVHVYFHDTDLLDARRRRALVAALAILGLRRPVLDLDQLAARVAASAPARPIEEL